MQNPVFHKKLKLARNQHQNEQGGGGGAGPIIVHLRASLSAAGQAQKRDS